LAAGAPGCPATPADGRHDAAENVAEHEALLRAVERRDVPGARQAMERHLQPVVDRSIDAPRHEASFKRAALLTWILRGCGLGAACQRG
jgi:hypothetical protein